jgi:hypothetical protein
MISESGSPTAQTSLDDVPATLYRRPVVLRYGAEELQLGLGLGLGLLVPLPHEPPESHE